MSISSIFMIVASFFTIDQNDNEVDLTFDEKEAIKPGLYIPKEWTSPFLVKIPLRKKLKTMVEKQVQKRQDALGKNSNHCLGVKKWILPVDCNAE